MNDCNILQITLLIGFGWNLSLCMQADVFEVLSLWLFSMAPYLWSCYMLSKFPHFFSCIVSHRKHVCKESSCLERLVEKWGGTLHCSGSNLISVFRTESDVSIKVSFANKLLQEQGKLLSMLSSFHSGVTGCVKWWINGKMLLEWKHA